MDSGCKMLLSKIFSTGRALEPKQVSISILITIFENVYHVD